MSHTGSGTSRPSADADRPVVLLPELSEALATGRIAEIYTEIRRFSGVPYVSSLQRYLATLPGVLEWAWATLRPAMAAGAISEAGWRLAAELRLSPPDPIPAARLQRWGVDHAARATIRNVAANFVRVSPVNLVTGACISQLLAGPPLSGAGWTEPWHPPDSLPPMPGNVDPAALPPSERAVLMRFATDVGGVPFIPALYRQLAHWPAFLAWLADALAPRFEAPETRRLGIAARSAAAAAATNVIARLPPPEERGAPDRPTAQLVQAAVDRYGQTSPEMMLFGRLILDALPAGAAARP